VGLYVPRISNREKDKRNGIEAPEIGRWYCSSDGSLFEVVAMDENDGTIEIQHFDGTLDETEPEGWIALRAETAEAPEDWSGSVDISIEDIPGTSHAAIRDWQSAMELVDENRSRITEIE
jgi:hypothetical protein